MIPYKGFSKETHLFLTQFRYLYKRFHLKFVCKNVIHLRFLYHQKVLIVENSTKVLFTVRYTNRQITALTFFAITKIAGKGRIL